MFDFLKKKPTTPEEIKAENFRVYFKEREEFNRNKIVLPRNFTFEDVHKLADKNDVDELVSLLECDDSRLIQHVLADLRDMLLKSNNVKDPKNDLIVQSIMRCLKYEKSGIHVHFYLDMLFGGLSHSFFTFGDDSENIKKQDAKLKLFFYVPLREFYYNFLINFDTTDSHYASMQLVKKYTKEDYRNYTDSVVSDVKKILRNRFGENLN